MGCQPEARPLGDARPVLASVLSVALLLARIVARDWAETEAARPRGRRCVRRIVSRPGKGLQKRFVDFSYLQLGLADDESLDRPREHRDHIHSRRWWWRHLKPGSPLLGFETKHLSEPHGLDHFTMGLASRNLPLRECQHPKRRRCGVQRHLRAGRFKREKCPSAGAVGNRNKEPGLPVAQDDR